MGNNRSELMQQTSSTSTTSNSLTRLYEACRDGDEEQVRNLLPKYSHAELNRQEQQYEGNTCLHIAAQNGHDNIVKLLLKHGSYRSSLLNAQNQSAYDVAALHKESTRLLFVRQDESDPSAKSASRFSEQNVSECFDIVTVENNEEDNENLVKNEQKSSVQTYKTEAEKQHEMGYSASSKAMCQSRLGRFCVNRFHPDEPLNHRTMIKRLRNLLEQNFMNNSIDNIKIDDLINQYQKNCNSIEQLLHLYTLETKFYRSLKQDSLPLAIPLFTNLPKLKKRFFKGHVYRGMHMSHEQILTYQTAMKTPETLLQTSSFSSTSIDRTIAEQFAYLRSATKSQKGLCVLFIFDFPNVCDQAINLSRMSRDIPCLSEYEDEKEVLILPWTLFQVTQIEQTDAEDISYTIYLTNVIIPKKSLLSTFRWTGIEMKNQLTRDKKMKLDCAFQKYKQQQ